MNRLTVLAAMFTAASASSDFMLRAPSPVLGAALSLAYSACLVLLCRTVQEDPW
jgi:hypothetical protein